MTLTNTNTRYGAFSKLFHWLTALGILIMIPLGMAANNAPSATPADLTFKVQLFSAHKTLGVLVFVLALIRIIWMLSQPKPAPLHPERRLETFAAETVHFLLYGSLVLVPLSGWVEHAATTGFAPILWPFGQSLPFVPKSPQVAETMAMVHIVLVRILVLSLILHIAGAVKHVVIDRDQTLARMLPEKSNGQPDVAPKPHDHKPIPPLFTALTVWLAGFAIAIGTGSFSHSPAHAPAQSVQLDQVKSGWHVQSGEIALGLKQFGAPVAGGFAEWTAEINFDDSAQVGKVGDTTVTIAIGSVSIGSVTAQALGGDYFDAATFPTAQFTADLLLEDGQYRAEGNLQIKDQQQPLSFPFQLTVEGDSAQMSAEITLNRRDFGIGLAVTDEGQLANDVVVSITLTALRQ